MSDERLFNSSEEDTDGSHYPFDEMTEPESTMKRNDSNLKFQLFDIKEHLRCANCCDSTESKERLDKILHDYQTPPATSSHDAAQNINMLIDDIGLIRHLKTTRLINDTKYLSILQLLRNQIGILCANGKQKCPRQQEVLTIDKAASNAKVCDKLTVKPLESKIEASGIGNISLLTKLIRDCFADIKELIVQLLGGSGESNLCRENAEHDKAIENCNAKIRELALHNTELMERIELYESQAKATEVQVKSLTTHLKAADALIQVLKAAITQHDNVFKACGKQIEELIDKLSNRAVTVHVAEEVYEVTMAPECKSIDKLVEKVHGYHNAVNGLQLKINEKNVKTVQLLDNIKRCEQQLSASSTSVGTPNSDKVDVSLPKTIETPVFNANEQKLSVMFPAHAIAQQKTSAEPKRNTKSCILSQNNSKSKWSLQCKSDKNTAKGRTSKSYAQPKNSDEHNDLNCKNKAKTVHKLNNIGVDNWQTNR